PLFDRQWASDAGNGLGRWRGRRRHRLIGFGRVLGMDRAHRIAGARLRRRSLMRAFPRLLSVPCNPLDLPSQSDSRLGRLPEGPAPQGALAFMLPQRDRRCPAVPTTDDLECVCAGMAQIDVTEIAWIISHLNLSEPVALGDENAEPWRI